MNYEHGLVASLDWANIKNQIQVHYQETHELLKIRE